ncbi:hypothetical protein INT43_008396 [Umbelopsis isabellina]|uniref:Rho-GAP domain-containing protein n=1 Tax=Mortierella isabellina TaxID=91625 RepID=A0A8H7UGH9_MORIS|nr:hypothetical protein INT43_008396 [Umbelopsis isabellina]
MRFGELFMTNMRKSQLQIEVITTDQFNATKEDATIFGAPLKEILERSSFSTKGGLCIPYVLHRCFTEIAKKGIKSEGLFRLSGSAPKILQLEKLFSEAPDFGKDVDLTPYDVHTLAGTFKKLLRSLPEPVIPHQLHVYYLNGYSKSSSNERNLALLSSLGHRMNRYHFDLLKYIIAIAAYVEKEKAHNKMTAEALAIVLAPTCTGLDGIINKLPNNKEKERGDKLSVSLGRNTFNRSAASHNVLPLSIVKDLEQWTSLFQFMIVNHEKLLVNWTNNFDYEETKIIIPDIPEQKEPEDEEEIISQLKASFEALPISQKEDTKLRFDEFPELTFKDFELPDLTIAPVIKRDYMRDSWQKDNVEILTRSKSAAALSMSQSCEHFFAEPEVIIDVSTPIFATNQRKTFKPAVNTEMSSFSRSVQSARPYSPSQRPGDGKYFEILSQWKSREDHLAHEQQKGSQAQKQEQANDDAIAEEPEVPSEVTPLDEPSAAVGQEDDKEAANMDQDTENTTEESSFAEPGFPIEQQDEVIEDVAEEQPEELPISGIEPLIEEQAHENNINVDSEASLVSSPTALEFSAEQQEVLLSAESVSPQMVSLRDEDDCKNKRKDTPFPDTHMNKLPSGQSLDSGVYSTDGLSLSDL